jgi:exopolyphosphatase / guanosine-5'-triphosphate,3'-diphosphate pyrophosphatase
LKDKDKDKAVASVIDIGSNTIKFLVAKGPDLKVLDECSDDTRIGIGMGKSDKVMLQPAAIEAAVDCVKRLYKRASKFKPTYEAVVATSAVRDAVNREEFISRVRETIGLDIRILSGDEEAQYVGTGVSKDPNIDSRKPFYLMDLGGGSLEILEFSGGLVRQKVSLPLGAVRLKEKLVKDPAAPMSRGEMSEISEYIAEAISGSGFAFRTPGAMVGTGGGLTHARLILGHEKGEKGRKTTTPILSLTELRTLTKRVCAMNIEERTKLHKLPLTRADIMPVALIVITTVMELATANSVVHSFYNLRYGMAAELLGSSRRGDPDSE